MSWGNQTHWRAGDETIDQWLEREQKASRLVENPTCPHCDHVHEEWHFKTPLVEEGYLEPVDDAEIECDSCDQKFIVTKETRVRFECRKP